MQTVPFWSFTNLGGEHDDKKVPLTSQIMIFIEEFPPNYQRATCDPAVISHLAVEQTGSILQVRYVSLMKINMF